jgi:hypothetical protein
MNVAHKANIEAIAERERAKNRYGTDDGDTYWHSSYEEIVRDFGCEVPGWETLGSYQGDHLVLLRDGERWGFTVIGYGSCSGCDALEAAGENVREVQALADGIFDGIHWEPSAEAMAAHLASRDGANEWWINEDEAASALDRFRLLLAAPEGGRNG